MEKSKLEKLQNLFNYAVE